MAEDKRGRRDELLGRLTKQRFEEEVANEIGISLSRKTGRASRRARGQVASPGAAEVAPQNPSPRGGEEPL
ncbi:MAG: hypothetical protein C4551_09800 [Bacillota bacterium]|nr:MAG: hypothetical protein C4551_09800 [Bacillota bacterium]